MNLLVDTRALLWAIDSPEKLSDRGRECLADPLNRVSFSTVSLWEIAIKTSIGRLVLDADWRNSIESARTDLRARWLFLEPRHCHAVAELPWHHRDPFDRMLIAQAATEGMTLLTRDGRFRNYGVEALW